MSNFFLDEYKGASQVLPLLVEKISNAIGRHFDPKQEVRMAKALVEADRITQIGSAETEFMIAELRQRTIPRWIAEEHTMQENMETIIKRSADFLHDEANPGNMEDDWITNFFDRCRIVSDNDMQTVWARILAGEANNPGSFSRKTINIMSDLDKQDALMFTSLCQFVWAIDHLAQPFVFDIQHHVYNNQGINFGSIGHLEYLGLVHYGGVSELRRRQLPQVTVARYFGQDVHLIFPNSDGNELNIGYVMFTSSGTQLSKICGAELNPEFFKYVRQRWESQGLLHSL